MKPRRVKLWPLASQPRYWPTWGFVALFWLLAQLPYSMQMCLGNILGQSLYYLLRRRRKIAECNIELCLPGLSAGAKKDLLHDHFSSLGKAAMESTMSWWGPVEKLDEMTHISGLEHLEEAKSLGHGVIVVSGHFTPIDMCLQIMSRCAPGYAIYRRNKNLLLDELTYRGRCRSGGIMFEREDMRTALQALRKNESVWFSPDQDHGLAQHGKFVEFFKQSAATVTTTARLAARTGAAVVPLLYRRLPAGAGYELMLLPALKDYPGSDLVVATRQINAIIEAQALISPEQYLWVHRRFKTRPPGTASVYEK